MGINNLMSYMKKKEYNIITKTSIKKLTKQGLNVYCIDFCLFMCAFTYKYNHDYYDINDAILRCVNRYLNMNVHVYFVLDGKSHQLKDIEKISRITHFNKNIQNKCKNVYEKMNNIKNIDFDVNNSSEIYKVLNIDDYPIDLIEEYNSIVNKNKAPFLDRDKTELIINNLKKIGCLFLKAEHEGEKLSADLCYNRLCHAVISKDSDVIASLSPITIIKTSFDKNMSCDVIYIKDVLKCLDLIEDQFIDFCILLGTDYNRNIPSMGPVKSYELIKEFTCIENIINHIENSTSLKNKYNCDNIKNYEIIRKLLKPCKYEELHVIYY